MFQKFKRMCRKAKENYHASFHQSKMLIIALLEAYLLWLKVRQAITSRYDSSINRSRGNREIRSCDGQTLLCHCWCCGHHRSHFGVYRHEQRGTGCQEEDYDGGWGVPFPDCGSPSITSILRN